MANKKATVFILDSNPSMGKWLKIYEATAFQKSKDGIQATLEEKVLAGRKTDQVGIVIAGTEASDNYLALEQPGQYQHITVMSQIKQPDLEVLRDFVNTPLMESKANTADVFDALILTVAMIKDFVKHLKYEKRIRLYTNLEGDINWDNIEAVHDMIRNCGIELSIACLGLNDAEEAGPKAHPNVKTNLANWKQLLHNLPNAFLIDLMDAIEESRQFHKKDIRPTPVYRGYLTFGDTARYPDSSIAISVNMYAKTMEAKVPSARKWSSVSNIVESKLDNGNESHQVIAENTYRIKSKDSENNNRTGNNNNHIDNDDEDDDGNQVPSRNTNDDDHVDDDDEANEVEKESLEKAYRFGKTLVVVSSETEEHLKLKTDPCMTVLAIYPRAAFPPQMEMSNVYVIVAGSHRPLYAAKAISAFAQALERRKSVALVRYVSRENVPPKLAIIKPVLQDDVDALYFVRVPFAEDYRDFTFNPLDRVTTASGKVITEDHPLLPTQDVRDAMSSFVKNMHIKEPNASDMDKGYNDDDEEPCIDLDEIYNPHIWLTQKAMIARVLNSAAPVPELDPRLKAQFDTPAKLINKNKVNVETLKRALNIKKVDRVSKRSKYGARAEQAVPDNLLPVDQLLDAKQVPDVLIKQEEQPENEYQNFVNYQTRTISPANPVPDFNAMINNRNEDLVSSAVEQMCAMITKTVSDSFGNRDYDKAYECLVVLRKAAAKEDESETFNKYMYQLKEILDPGNPNAVRRDFWIKMKQNNMTLISKEEAPDSQITPDEAKRYLEEEQPTRETVLQQESTDMSAEDLTCIDGLNVADI
ncbi:SPOC like C-terminal domain-containing protein [Phascolomyces articulosus]|uniref:ATP-dependent DNA helicase II subunit 2 n=1 Tax=Phascolomyces articulosus TaxID=60185 RepID=A0AAD5JX71_9FUNG|nr:SPOC like C-terminal domain-containing protein [Phascolomyces articulosus]